VDDEADEWDLGVSEGEREKGGARCGWAGRWWAGPRGRKERERGGRRGGDGLLL